MMLRAEPPEQSSFHQLQQLKLNIFYCSVAVFFFFIVSFHTLSLCYLTVVWTAITPSVQSHVVTQRRPCTKPRRCRNTSILCFKQPSDANVTRCKKATISCLFETLGNFLRFPLIFLVNFYFILCLILSISRAPSSRFLNAFFKN